MGTEVCGCAVIPVWPWCTCLPSDVTTTQSKPAKSITLDTREDLATVVTCHRCCTMYPCMCCVIGETAESWTQTQKSLN